MASDLFLLEIPLSGKRVHFNKHIDYIPPSLEDNKTRVNSFYTDQHRMRRLLEPILTAAHRNKIQTRNLTLQEPVNTTAHPPVNAKKTKKPS